MKTGYFDNKRVVVTGGNGFLGKCVVRNIRDYALSDDNIFTVSSKDYDLVKEENVIRMYEDLRPDVVIHLAAEVGGIGANMDNPGRFFYSNMAMGLHLIEQARLFNLEKFVQIGTICAYPKFASIPFREEDLWGGYPEETNAPYGIAKKSLLTMLQAYRDQYGLNGIFLLPVNLYGPGDNFDINSSHVIPALIKKIVEAIDINKKSIECWGTGEASREFLYVEDAARAVVKATEKYNDPEPVNIGAGFEITIKDLVEKIARLCGFSGDIIWDLSKPDGQPRRCLNVDKAKNYFDFQAEIEFQDGLKRTIDWYVKENKKQ
jgi:GDP-L-fucose synthase